MSEAILSLEAKHAGETVFIIGSGPALGSYSAGQLARLGDRICIGVNRTQYKVGLSYFLSSYISEVLLARTVLPDVFAIHTRRKWEPPLVAGLHCLKRVVSDQAGLVTNRFVQGDPYLVTRNNVIFLATHLALIMGAARIVYIGCDQRSGLHFYNEDDDVLARIVRDMCGVIAQHGDLLGRDHAYETPLNVMRALTVDAEKLRTQKFYTMDHGELLGQWLRHASQTYGVAFQSCTQDSVMVDAGAVYMPLDEALAL